MRYTLLIVMLAMMLSACKKDKYTTAPQISYKSIKPDVISLNIPIPNQQIPVLTIKITDAEGDIGFIDHQDTSKLFIKNLLTGKTDSTLLLPDISSAIIKNFQAEVGIKLSSNILIEGTTRPRPKTDTIYYEIYIKDFAKNKSNVIRTDDPVYVISL